MRSALRSAHPEYRARLGPLRAERHGLLKLLRAGAGRTERNRLREVEARIGQQQKICIDDHFRSPLAEFIAAYRGAAAAVEEAEDRRDLLIRMAKMAGSAAASAALLLLTKQPGVSIAPFILHFDDFNRSNRALAGDTSPGGVTWGTAAGSGAAILGNRFTMPGTASLMGDAAMTPTAKQRASITFRVGGGGPACRINIAGGTGFWAYWNGAGGAQGIYRWYVLEQIAAGHGTDAVDGEVLTIDADAGGNITALKEGAVTSGPANSGFYATGVAGAGIDTPTGEFDDFEIVTPIPAVTVSGTVAASKNAAVPGTTTIAATGSTGLVVETANEAVPGTATAAATGVSGLVVEVRYEAVAGNTVLAIIVPGPHISGGLVYRAATSKLVGRFWLSAEDGPPPAFVIDQGLCSVEVVGEDGSTVTVEGDVDPASDEFVSFSATVSLSPQNYIARVTIQAGAGDTVGPQTFPLQVP